MGKGGGDKVGVIKVMISSPMAFTSHFPMRAS
jgi:hypothetical protein